MTKNILKKIKKLKIEKYVHKYSATSKISTANSC